MRVCCVDRFLQQVEQHDHLAALTGLQVALGIVWIYVSASESLLPCVMIGFTPFPLPSTTVFYPVAPLDTHQGRRRPAPPPATGPTTPWRYVATCCGMLRRVARGLTCCDTVACECWGGMACTAHHRTRIYMSVHDALHVCVCNVRSCDRFRLSASSAWSIGGELRKCPFTTLGITGEYA